jgi:hypothetical protein
MDILISMFPSVISHVISDYLTPTYLSFHLM